MSDTVITVDNLGKRYRNGVLHEELSRLLRDDMRTATQAQSFLSLIGVGCARLSEIAGRLGEPAGSLTRALANLVDLGYVRRELPWGESPRSTKRAPGTQPLFTSETP
jgi:hypothetical protein